MLCDMKGCHVGITGSSRARGVLYKTTGGGKLGREISELRRVQKMCGKRSLGSFTTGKRSGGLKDTTVL